MADPKPRLLVIDDDAQLRDLLNAQLKVNGYAVAAAEDPVEAIKTILVEPPDLIICDINLPYMDGLELVRALRGDEATTHMPVIFLTAREDREAWTEARKIGVSDFLFKPVSVPQLLQAIEKALSEPARHML